MEDKHDAPDNKTVFKPRNPAADKTQEQVASPQKKSKSVKADESSAKPPVQIDEATVIKKSALQKNAPKTSPPEQSINTEAETSGAQSSQAAQPQSQKKTGATKSAQNKAPENKAPEHKGPENNAIELTRIQKSIRDQDSSQGFVLAKQTADEALSQNKIILNNRFVLESTLGGGGMGTVYRAKDLRKVEASDRNPYVAVKVLNDDFKNHPQAFITLQREASRSHILSHPNIVTVHDFDRDGDVIFMTMELLEGQSLDVFLRQHRASGLSLEDAKPILLDLCNALSFAHSKNIVHSDLKPGNIFVTENGSKILDFGIARLVNDASEDFDAGELGALTPSYASLEMLEGKSPAAEDDIYALAVIAYELLTGRHPFDRKSAEDAQQLGLKPNRIAGLSKQEWAAIEKALAFKREDRTPSVDDFMQGLLHKNRFPIFKLTTAVLLLISGALSTYFYLAPDKVDTIAQNALMAGQQCLEQKRYDCAVDAFKTVIELHPDHPEAKQLLAISLETKKNLEIETTSLALTDCLENQQDIVCAKTKLTALQNMAPANSVLEHAQHQIQQFELQQQISLQLEKASSCFEQNDFDCAHEALDEILGKSENHERAAALKNTIIAKQDALKSEKALIDNNYNAAISKGKKCLDDKKYDCAIQHFNEASKLKPNDTSARELSQTAEFEKKTARQNEERAKSFLAKGQACLEKKNYTCAIANAESSLEIIKNYAPALKLRETSKTELENIKKKITIQ